MAVVDSKSVNKTKFDNGGIGENSQDRGELQAGCLEQYDSFVTVAADATSTLSLRDLPEGAKIRGIEVTYGALGTSVTIDIGDSDSVNRYMDAAALVDAGGVSRNMLPAGVNYIIGTNDGDEVMIITFNVAVIADEAIKVRILYVW
jgi:hypothetical protein